MKSWVMILATFVLASTFPLVGCSKEAPAEPATETTTTEPATEEPKTDPAANLPAEPTEGEEVAVLETESGKIVVMFYPDVAPKHVENFKSLVSSGFYDGTRFHRCMPGFMIQGGDPKTKDVALQHEWGTGGNMVDGKEKTIPAEFNSISHERGILSMARSNDPNSASSQFFLMHQVSPFLDGQYTAFGKVVSGLEVIDRIVATGPTDPNLNGTVDPRKAVVLKKATIQKWPVKE
ncbi:peptidylprolyl isomerase [Kamptonema cortianum]|nr:peptidylprolyl isomerase [Geitlerinema splendidum]MDK3155858.1 peptidylprolyl isomerase [Kamptonema cortianum]